MPARPYGSDTDYNLLRLALQEGELNTVPGRRPSNMATNAYISSIPRSAEQEREANLLDSLDAEAQKRRTASLAESDAVRSAREEHGYGSQFPLEEAAQAEQADKLALAGAPAAATGRAQVGLERAKGEEQRRNVHEFAAVAQMLNNGSGAQAPSPGMSAGAPAGTPNPLAHALSTQKALDTYATQHNTPTTSPRGRTYLDGPTSAPPPANAVVAGEPPQMSEDFTPPTKFKMGMGAAGNATLTQEPDLKLSAPAQETARSIRSAYRLMGEVRDLIKQQGVASDQPEAGMPGFLGQLGDVAKASGTRELYGLGFQDPTLGGDPHSAALYDKITQLTELSKVLASKGFQGSMRNMTWIRQIQDHLANGRQPTGTQLQRINTMMEEYPRLLKDLYDTSYGNPMTLLPQE